MRLIDSEILIKKAVENRSCNLSNAKYEMKNGNFKAVQQFLYYASFYALVIEMIKNVPTIKEKTQGKWIKDDFFNDNYYANCSECGYQMDVHYERGYFNYCPNCGARMKGDTDEL